MAVENNGYITKLAFSGDGKYLAASSGDIWETATGKNVVSVTDAMPQQRFARGKGGVAAAGADKRAGIYGILRHQMVERGFGRLRIGHLREFATLVIGVNLKCDKKLLQVLLAKHLLFALTAGVIRAPIHGRETEQDCGDDQQLDQGERGLAGGTGCRAADSRARAAPVCRPALSNSASVTLPCATLLLGRRNASPARHWTSSVAVGPRQDLSLRNFGHYGM